MAPKPKPSASPRKTCEAFFIREIAEIQDFPGTSRVVDARNEMVNTLRDRLSQDGDLVREQDTRQWQAFFVPPVAPHTQLNDLPGDLKIVFSASDPAQTRLGMSLEENRRLNAKLEADESAAHANAVQYQRRLSEMEQKIKDVLMISQNAFSQVNRTAKLEQRLEAVEEETAESRSTVAALKLEIKTLKQGHKTEVQDLTERLEREKEGRAADSEPLLDRIRKLEERAKEDHKTMKDSSDRLKQLTRVLQPLWRRMLLDSARKKIYEALEKGNWQEVLAEYNSPDSQLVRRLRAKGMELTRRALDLIWDGRAFRVAGNDAAHEAPARDVRLGVTSVGGTNREAFEDIYLFVYGSTAEIEE